MDKNVSLKFKYSYVISSILILIMHCSGGNLGNGKTIESIVALIVCKLGVPAVAWFIFMSGYFTFRKEQEYSSLIKRRIKALVVPYLTWNVIAVLWYLGIYDRLFGERVCYPSSLKDVILFFVPFRSANPGLWTVALLMIYVSLYPIILKLISISEKYSLIVIIIIELTIAITATTASNVFYWLPLYSFGAWMGYYQSVKIENWISCDKLQPEGKRRLLNTLSRSVFIIVVALGFVFSHILPELVVETILRFISPLLFFYCLKNTKIRDNDYERKLRYNRISFLIYVSHGMIINVFGTLVLRNISFESLLFRYGVICFITLCIEAVLLFLMKKMDSFKYIWILYGGRE